MEEERPFHEEDLLIPVGYKVCEVMPLTDYKISKRTLIYQTDDITIKQLINQYQDNERLTPKLNEKKEKVCFLLGKSKLSVEENVTLKQIRLKLHNFKTTSFVFYPYIQQSGALINQCSTSYEKHQDYSDERHANNKKSAFLYFSQITQKSIRYDLQCNKTVFSEIVAILRKSDFAQNAKLWEYEMQIECLTCITNKKIMPNQLVAEAISDSHKVQVTFPKFKAIRGKDERQKISIRINQCKDKEIKTFTYAEIGDLSVEAILQFCSIQQPYQNGLRILDKYLKPFDLLSSLHSKIMEKAGIIDAFLTYQSQFFYRSFTEQNEKKIALDSKDIKEKIDKERQRLLDQQNKKQIQFQAMKLLRDKRINELSNVNNLFKQREFIDPIWCYTSPYIFSKLNKFLREMNFLKMSKNDIRQSWDIQFTYCLINSLLKLPNHHGTVYRGTPILQDFKVGSIQCFKSFFSASRSKQLAEGFSRKTIFTIKCLSGKDIQQFSFYKNEEQILIFPFTRFKVLSVEKVNESNLIELEELPGPKRLDQNMIVWVDENPQSNIEIFNEFKQNQPQIKSELIQLLSNDHLNLWLQYYGHHLLNPNIQVKAITNMNRREDPQAGVETINRFRKLDPNIEIITFVANSPRALEILKANKLALNDKLILENRGKWLKDYIQQKIIATEKGQKPGCEVM